jgi:hypothetical protein
VGRAGARPLDHWLPLLVDPEAFVMVAPAMPRSRRTDDPAEAAVTPALLPLDSVTVARVVPNVPGGNVDVAAVVVEAVPAIVAAPVVAPVVVATLAVSAPLSIPDVGGEVIDELMLTCGFVT